MARSVNPRRATSAPGRGASRPSRTGIVGGRTVGIVMGSDSDWETMQRAAELLREFGVPFESRVVSAHRTPRLLYESAELQLRVAMSARPGPRAPRYAPRSHRLRR
jgi:hypothetical protein